VYLGGIIECLVQFPLYTVNPRTSPGFLTFPNVQVFGSLLLSTSCMPTKTLCVMNLFYTLCAPTTILKGPTSAAMVVPSLAGTMGPSTGCFRCGDSGHRISGCPQKLHTFSIAQFAKPVRPPAFSNGPVSRSRGFKTPPPNNKGGSSLDFIPRGASVVGRPLRPGPYVVGGGHKPSQPAAAGEETFTSNTGVYVVELHGGRYYVGQSGNIERRMLQHKGELRGGSAWTSEHGVVRRLQPKTPPQTDLESWERSETLFRMKLHGVDAVRGWMYTSVELTQAQREHIFQQVCEKFGLCRVCGGGGHFASACTAKSRAIWYTRSDGGPVHI
jgi:hypothetical protein